SDTFPGTGIQRVRGPVYTCAFFPFSQGSAAELPFLDLVSIFSAPACHKLIVWLRRGCGLVADGGRARLGAHKLVRLIALKGLSLVPASCWEAGIGAIF